MVLPFFRKKRLSDPVLAVYNVIVAQSRQEIFYAQWGVPDTVTGRFDMISLHMALVLRRLRAGDQVSKDFSQNLFDFFFLDMDRSLRETGVGDLSVPKRIEKMGSLFYGMLSSLNAAMDGDGKAASLEDIISRNFIAEGHERIVPDFAHYIREREALLRTQNTAAIVLGKIELEDTK